MPDTGPVSYKHREARTRGWTLERHDRWLENRGVAPTPIGKFLVMEHEPVVGRISLVLGAGPHL